MFRTFIFLTLLIAFSYCTERKADNINQIIDELVELNKGVKGGPGGVGALVGKIKAASRDAAKAFKAFYAGVEANCDAGKGFLKSFTAKLKGDLIGAKAAINDAKKEVEEAEKNTHKYKEGLEKVKETMEKAQKRQVKEAAFFRKNLLEASGKLTVIKHVRDIVVDELLNGPPPKGTFIQLKVKEVNEKLNELKTLAENSKDDDLFATTITTLIAMVSEKNLSDQKIVRKFLKALAKLRNKLSAYKKTSLASRKKVLALQAKTRAARLKSLRALGRLLIQAKSDKVGAGRQIGELKNAVHLIGKGLSKKANELKHWTKLCVDQARIMKIFKDGEAELHKKVKDVTNMVMQ